MKGYLYKEIKQNRVYFFLTALAALCAAFLPIIIIMLSEKTIAREAFLIFAQSGMIIRVFCIAAAFIASLTFQSMTMKGDDTKKWGYFVASNPKGIKGFICTKYAFVGALALLMFLLSAGFDLIFTLIANTVGGIGTVNAAKVFLVLFFIQLLYNSVELPLIIRFGAKVGNTVKLILGIIVSIIIALIFIFNPAGLASFISMAVMEGDFSAVPKLIKWLMPVVSVVLYVLSCLLSCRLYMKGVNGNYK